MLPSFVAPQSRQTAIDKAAEKIAAAVVKAILEDERNALLARRAA